VHDIERVDVLDPTENLIHKVLQVVCCQRLRALDDLVQVGVLPGFGVEGCGLRVAGLGSRVWCLGLRVYGLGFGAGRCPGRKSESIQLG
jgi:hypothetical protein